MIKRASEGVRRQGLDLFVGDCHVRNVPIRGDRRLHGTPARAWSEVDEVHIRVRVGGSALERGEGIEAPKNSQRGTEACSRKRSDDPTDRHIHLHDENGIVRIHDRLGEVDGIADLDKGLIEVGLRDEHLTGRRQDVARTL